MEPRDLGGWAMLGLYATGAAAGFVATVVLDKLLGHSEPLGYDPRLTDPGPPPVVDPKVAAEILARRADIVFPSAEGALGYPKDLLQ